MASARLKILVNAIPLTNIKTGIGRYVEGLYKQIESYPGVEVGYFDGRKVCKHMPRSGNDGFFPVVASFFWKLPTYFSLMLRLLAHCQMELAFRRVCKEFDIYHETSFFPFLSSIPVVFTIHDLTLLLHPDWHPKERVLYFRMFFKKRLRISSAVITVSNFTKSEFTKTVGFPDDRVFAIHLGCDRSVFYPRTLRSVAKLKTKYDLPDTYYLFVGTGDPRKNFLLVQKVLPYMRYPLVVVGWSGWLPYGMMDKKTLFLGYVSDDELACIYSGARALIFPSLYEGFGLPVLEAMSCGCPVIVSRQASLPEVAGNAALYLNNPHSSEELIRLLRMLDDPDKVEKRRRLVIEQASRFSWERTAWETLRVFEQVLGTST